MKALIVNGRVAELNEEGFPVAEPFFWADVVGDVAVGWSYVDGVFSPPPAPAPEPVTSVTRRQARLALLEVGRLDDVESAIAAIADPIQQRAAQIEYEADTWERGNAFLQATWVQIGGTEQELDDLFALAATK